MGSDGEVLYHYCRGERRIRTLSDLSLAEGVALAEEHTFLAAARFRDAALYLADRRRVEAALRRRFLALGGVVRRQNPLYFVVRPAVSFFERHERGLLRGAVPLASLPEDGVSFTYGDSQINWMIAAGTWPHPTPSRQPWHGEVYRWGGLQGLIDQLGWPPPWQPGQAPYVEAQVWVDVAPEQVTWTTC